MEHNKTAILFVHGFMGSRRQFYGLRDDLGDCGADIVLHILPGHDTTIEDFRGTNGAIWQESVTDKVRKLSGEYDRILLVGHSMGGLLAVRAAIAEPEKICGVVAIGFPIKIKLRPQWLNMNLKAAHPAKEGEDPRVTAARKMAGVRIQSAGQYFSTFPNNMQFLKIVRESQKEIGRLKAPLTVINFEKDEIVSPSAGGFIISKLPQARIVMLPDSYHFLFTDDERRMMAEEIKKMI